MSEEEKVHGGGKPTSLMGLFEPPSETRTRDVLKEAPGPQQTLSKVKTKGPPHNGTARRQESPLKVTIEDSHVDEGSSSDVNVARRQDTGTNAANLLGLFAPPSEKEEFASKTESTPLIDDSTRATVVMGNMSSYADFGEDDLDQRQQESKHSSWRDCMLQILLPTTWIGAFMFLLYHIVFSLTMGAAITRTHGGSPVFGAMTKMSASGVMFASLVYWWSLSDDIPALYPAVDLFCAPFLANLAAVVDETLYYDDSLDPKDNDAVFLASFCFLMCLGLTITATLLMLASVFKLANLGAFLPSPVLSGFFAAVGVLLWTLAVKVDTGGMSVGQVLFSGNWSVISQALIHHVPSLVAAGAMKYFSSKSPFYVVACILSTIALFYVYMGVAGVNLSEMVERGWFWSKDDLVSQQMDPETVGFAAWAPPAPAGWINSWWHGKVHWKAVEEGFPTALALAFLYMIRCSLHGAALKKNIAIMEKLVPADQVATTEDDTMSVDTKSLRSIRFGRSRRFSEAVDIKGLSVYLSPADLDNDNEGDEKKMVAISSPPTHHSLTFILAQYAYSQYVCAFVGGFAMTPSIGPSSTMYALGAESVAAQVGSVILLSVFYFTNFQLVQFIPKPAFSSVLCLAAIDIMDGWFIKSYQKTKSKIEWLVNPFIVVTAFSVGLLSAVFLGIGLSTFFFVASFYRSGVVKYVANGISMRSTIERPPNMEQWLDENGDLLQILVLQSYLFFGNASSVLSYVTSMFEESDRVDDEFASSMLPPLPKIVVLDFSLVSGMDGSAVDVMADLLAVCSNHDCRLFLSGMSPSIQTTLQLGGVKPDAATRDRSKRKLRFFPDLDSAVGKAEDLLIKLFYYPTLDDEQRRRHLVKEIGFHRCLSQIDNQHQTSFQIELAELGSYTKPVTLQPGKVLYEGEDFADRGLFFIEEGTMRIDRSADTTRSLTRARSSDIFNPCGSLNQLKARSSLVARQVAHVKAQKGAKQAFRLARIGPGWILGEHEALSGLVSSGATATAVDYCRLHFISYSTLEELEKEKPMLILQLYKLLSKQEALRSELAIGQLATMHKIMSAAPHNRPLTNRSGLAQKIE